MKSPSPIPSHIIVGPPQGATERAHEVLRSYACATPELAGCFCRSCRAIANHQHHALMWINPTKDYTLADLEPLLQQVSFALDEGEKFFFVLEHAERLTQATANRLLKILEEPPRGYHFLLLTNSLGALLPTITSRSLINRLADEEHGGVHPLVRLFLLQDQEDLTAQFESCLQQNQLTDSESEELLAQLFAQLHQRERELLARGEAAPLAQEQLEFLQHAMTMPPQSGSSALFWKYLWLHFPR